MKQAFAAKQKIGKLGSKPTFAANSPSVSYADLAAVCCTLHHSLVLTICDFGYDAWQAEISN